MFLKYFYFLLFACNAFYLYNKLYPIKWATIHMTVTMNKTLATATAFVMFHKQKLLQQNPQLTVSFAVWYKVSKF